MKMSTGIASVSRNLYSTGWNTGDPSIAIHVTWFAGGVGKSTFAVSVIGAETRLNDAVAPNAS